MAKQKRYCFSLNAHLWMALKIVSGDGDQSLAEWLRRLIIREIIEESPKLDLETQKFILNQLKLSIEEISDNELNPIAKKNLLKVLTLRLNSFQ